MMLEDLCARRVGSTGYKKSKRKEDVVGECNGLREVMKPATASCELEVLPCRSASATARHGPCLARRDLAAWGPTHSPSKKSPGNLESRIHCTAVEEHHPLHEDRHSALWGFFFSYSSDDSLWEGLIASRGLISMAFRKNLTADSPVPTELWSDDQIAPPRLLDVLSQIAHFLDQLGYTETFTALLKEAKKSGLTVDIAEWERGIKAKSAVPLLELFEGWFDEKAKFPTLPGSDDAQDSSSESSNSEADPAEGVLVDVEAEETSDDDSDEESSGSSDSESDSSSGSSSASSAKAGAKRKRVLTPSSSSGDSDSSDDSSSESESDSRPAKRTKTTKSNTTQSASSSNDSSSSSSESDDNTSSESGDSSASSSEADSSSSDSDESASPPLAKNKKKQGGKDAKPTTKSESKDTSSQSSATLDAESAPEKEPESEPNHVHPDRLRHMPASKKEVATAEKKKHVPFSRIPQDQKVDPRFASNEYVSYDYADRAYRDLVVTKGKGFTKEKNKKKRGKQIQVYVG